MSIANGETPLPHIYDYPPERNIRVTIVQTSSRWLYARYDTALHFRTHAQFAYCGQIARFADSGERELGN